MTRQEWYSWGRSRNLNMRIREYRGRASPAASALPMAPHAAALFTRLRSTKLAEDLQIETAGLNSLSILMYSKSLFN